MPLPEVSPLDTLEAALQTTLTYVLLWSPLYELVFFPLKFSVMFFCLG